MSYFFVSLGSNIDPEQNFSGMLNELQSISQNLELSRIIMTNAEGFDSQQTFLNAVVRLQTNLSRLQLKQRFNEIEQLMGRDRDDPLSKVKDRVADLDILFSLAENERLVVDSLLPPEFYVQPLLVELLDCLGYENSGSDYTAPAGATISWCGQPIGSQPVLIQSGLVKSLPHKTINELSR